MKTRHCHPLFALAALVAAIALGRAWHERADAARADAAIAAIATAPSATRAAPTTGADLPAKAFEHAAAIGDRRLRLAWAQALERAGRLDDAAKLHATLIDRTRLDDLGAAALFNLGNAYLRTGIRLTGHGDGSERTAMLELAKQRYRDLLRLRPYDWEARYNLERALRLAPEDSEAGSAAHDGPTEQRRIMLKGSREVELP